ncbi:integrin alpha-L-like [Pipra filicauda]|uniref:Integrin alpha-L-like n=1 Tax=Pipra filicauda TaxID=649802 RepID=A0A6J2ILI0_9PASS|nr:integrin alpha-L-like [Pipra filicauda]
MAAVGHSGIISIVFGVLLAALPHIGAFSIHPVPHRVLTPGQGRSFGHQVLPLDGARVLVGAPAEVGDGGRLFQCSVQSGECQKVQLEGNSTRTHIGMALARDGDITIACGPGSTHICDRNVYTNGVCVLLDPQLRTRQELMPGYQGCQRGPVDLVFLFDDSSSMSTSQFKAIRDFMVDVMEKLQNTSIHFGAVQFSDRVQTVFTLKEFAARPQPRELLQGLEQRGGLTDTFAAIGFVAKELFSEEAGARPGARRVLVMITDGDATDHDPKALDAAEERGIHRYVIGVGNNFNSPDTKRYLQQFASGPGFVKVLESFERLRGLFQELQARLYDIEGTTQLHSFHLEMCSSGISVDVIQGRRVTGAVGADNWAGGLLELLELQENETFVPNPHPKESRPEGYLGYALAGLRVPGRALVAAGAPRHLYVGGVVLFEVPETTGDWKVLQTLEGEQVGSYFGATLCALDQGGGTVALLVGAPSHYDGRWGGRVHLYRWEEDALHPSGQLYGAPGHPLGRFGASLATLGDLDGDNLPEVAVGAPLEDEERGAVYIFWGHPGGVELHPRQRLQGDMVALGRFFGQAVAGGLDLTGDGLADMAVGMEGHVVVMRSRPVLRVTTNLTFDPPVISTRGVDCSDVTIVTIVTLQLCLHRPGDLLTPVTFRVDVDPQRAQGRGEFGEGQRSWDGEMQPGLSCQSKELRVLPCLEDFVTPIRASVTIALPDRDPPGPILPPSTGPTWVEIPFEQNCGDDEVCEADLGVRVMLGDAAVLGVPSAELRVQLTVDNRREDAYKVALQVQHPPGVSYRWARASQASAPVPITCWDAQGAEGQPWGLSCNLSYPILRAGWQVMVEVTFDLQQNATWGKSVGLMATVSSENEPNITLGDNTKSWDVPVHFVLDLVASWQEDSTPHLNFTPPQPHNKTLRHHYRVELLRAPTPGSPKTQATPFVLLPQVLPHGVAVAAPQVQVDLGGPCVAVEPQLGDAVGQELNRSIAETCSTPHLRLFRCPPTQLTPGVPVGVTVSAALRPLPHSQGPAHSHFCSALWLTLVPPFLATPQFLRAQGVTEVELLWEVNPLPGYVGGGVGGLLLLLLIVLGLAKCGFFQRNYRERMEREGPEEGEGEGEESPPSGESPKEGDSPS